MEYMERAVEMYRTKKAEDTPENQLLRIGQGTDRKKGQVQSPKEEGQKNNFQFACVSELVFSSLRPNTF